MMKSYSEYKYSGVEWLGDIPSHWSSPKISYLMSHMGSGTTPTSTNESYYGGEIPWVTTSELRESLITDTKKKVTEIAVFENSALKVHPVQSIVIAMYGATVGRLAKLGIESTTNQACCVLPPSNKVNTDFLYYWLMCHRTEIVKLSYGSGQPNISKDTVANIRISLPTGDEQTAIVDFLHVETYRIDNLINEKQHFIKLLQEKRQALISHVVTKGLDPDVGLKTSGVEWIGEIPENWTMIKFSHFIKIRSGQVDPNNHPWSEYILIAPNHIESKSGRIIAKETAREQGAESGKYLCKKGEVIYSKIRPALAKACISEDDNVICSADMYPLTCDKRMLNDYLLYLILSSEFTRLAGLESGRVAMPKINRESLAKIKFPAPPVSEQIKALEYIRAKTQLIDSLAQETQISIEFLREHRAALISAAVTGKIDLRDKEVA